MGAYSTRDSTMSKFTRPGKDWQALWFTTRQAPWTSLAIVPSNVGVEVSDVVTQLGAAGKLCDERRVHLLDSRGLHMDQVKAFLEGLTEITERGEWALVAVDPMSYNPSAVPIARGTSHAILVVQLGQSLMQATHDAT